MAHSSQVSFLKQGHPAGLMHCFAQSSASNQNDVAQLTCHFGLTHCFVQSMLDSVSSGDYITFTTNVCAVYLLCC